MRKSILLSTLTLMTATGIMAAPLSPEEAFSRLEESGRITSIAHTRAHQAALPLNYTVMTAAGEPALYVFSKGENSGFYIVSADDAATPLLGYSESGTFDSSNIPPALEYWLGEYQKQIEIARENNVKTRAEGSEGSGVTLPSSWTKIEPLIKTKWNQDAPYNDLCPLQNGTTPTFAGCVAVSVAQAMKYFNYPEKGKGKPRYEWPWGSGNYLTLNMASETFRWDYMLDDYSNGYSKAEGVAVATLIRDVGYCVQMQYSSSASGAVSGLIPSALVTYFSYDKSVRYYYRAQYAYSEWAQMLYDNLKNIGPVVYDGEGAGGGHSWICDGYDGNGLFHFNWGWGGMSDGYYALDALDPSSLGIGGGAGSYNQSQGAVFNIQPAKTDSDETVQNNVLQYGSLIGVYDEDGSLKFDLTNSTEYAAGLGYQGGQLSYSIVVGAKFENVDNPTTAPVYAKGTNPNYSNGVIGLSPLTIFPFEDTQNGVKYDLRPRFSLSDINLPDGKYKVTGVYSQPNVTDDSWSPLICDNGFYNYFYLTKQGSDVTITNESPLSFGGSNVKTLTPLYYSHAANMEATITNTTDTELTRNVTFAFVATGQREGRLAFVGKTKKLITLAPNGSITDSWNTDFERQVGIPTVNTDTEFYPALYDTDLGELIYTSDQTVVMSANPGTPNKQNARYTISVVGATPVKDGSYDQYPVEDAVGFDVEATITLDKGYLSAPISLGIYSRIGQTAQAELTSSFPLGEYVYLMAADSPKTWLTHVSLPKAEPGDLFYLALLNLDNMQQLFGYAISTSIIIEGNSGVESLTADSSEMLFLVNRGYSSVNILGGENGISSVSAVYLNGMKAPVEVEYIGGNAYVNLSGLGKGLIILTATDNAGNVKSEKIAL